MRDLGETLYMSHSDFHASEVRISLPSLPSAQRRPGEMASGFPLPNIAQDVVVACALVLSHPYESIPEPPLHLFHYRGMPTCARGPHW